MIYLIPGVAVAVALWGALGLCAHLVRTIGGRSFRVKREIVLTIGLLVWIAWSTYFAFITGRVFLDYIIASVGFFTVWLAVAWIGYKS